MYDWRDRRTARIGVLAAMFTAGSIAMAAAPPATTVENPSPQRAASPPGTQDPLYYPRSLRPTAPGASDDARSPDEVLAELRDLHSSLQHERALALADELIRILPDHPLAHYNHACVLARLRRIDAALDALERAIDLGWRRVAHTQIDFDLAPVRRSPRFAKLLARMGALVDAERPVPAPIRDEAWRTIADDLRRAMPDVLERYRVPGATVALIHDGAVVWTGSGGAHRSDEDAPMASGTRFPVAAPFDLLAIVASFHEQDRERLDLVDAVRFAMESTATAARPAGTGAAPHRGAVTVKRRATSLDLASSDVPVPTFSGRSALPELLRVLVEESSGTSFNEYCRRAILDPLGVPKDVLAGFEGPRELAVGHSALGTPLDGGRAEAATMMTSAVDLATLISALMRPDSQSACGEDHATRLGELARLDRELGGSLGLPMRLSATGAGPRFELAEERRGLGCLARWYPDTGSGVVVLYNAESGADAARHLAHVALGGGG